MDRLAAGVSTLGTQTTRVGRVIGLFKTLGMVLFAFMLIAFAYWQYSLVEVRSSVTSATITGIVLDAKTEQKTSYMAANYEFVVGTEKYTGQGTMYNPVVGNPVAVEYNPGNPRDNAIDTKPVNLAYMSLFAAMCVLFGAGVYFWLVITSDVMAGFQLLGVAAGALK